MAPSLEHAESEWLAQYATLRQVLAELKLEQPNGESKEYGRDVMLDDGDLTSSSGLDDMWNVFSDDDQDVEDSSDMLDDIFDPLSGDPKSGFSYGQEWLKSKCLTFVNSKSGIDAEELQRQLSIILVSDMRGLQFLVLLLPITE